MSDKDVPVVEMQNLMNAGFNAFGLQLFCESACIVSGGNTFKPLSFIFRNIKFTLEPQGEVDTSHH